MEFTIDNGKNIFIRISEKESAAVQIAADNLEDKITLKASFCLGRCGEYVTVKADNEFIDGVNAATIEKIYNEILKPKALKG